MTLRDAASTLFAHGRPGDPKLGDQVISLSNCEQRIQPGPSSVIIYGCPDDLGVTANRGRAGAAGGPDAIRAAFYKLCPPFTDQFQKQLQIFDAGNIEITSDILLNHSTARAAAVMVTKLGATVVALGGGHDYAAPNFLGWAEGIQTRRKPKTNCVMGLINVDPHLDVRELEGGLPHSGTPFREILESKMVTGQNFVEFGAREGRNALTHVQYCRKHKVKIMWFDDLKIANKIQQSFALALKTLAKTTTDIALTIDMDSCSDLEGVSAAPVIGFSAWELCQIAFCAGQNKKIGFLELAEVAPSLDPTGRSARIAAEVLFYFIKGRLSQSAKQ